MGSGLLETYCNDPAELRHFSIIGAGVDAAYATLIKRQQEPYMSFQRTLIHVAEGMEAARVDAIKRDPLTPDVGSPEGYIVITPTSYRILPAANATLAKLVADFGGRDTEDADDDQASRKALVDALFVSGTTKKQYAQGLRKPPPKRQLLECEHRGCDHMTQSIQKQIGILPAIEAECHLVQACREMFRTSPVPSSNDAALTINVDAILVFDSLVLLSICHEAEPIYETRSNQMCHFELLCLLSLA
jgi:hypothetical protein